MRADPNVWRALEKRDADAARFAEGRLPQILLPHGGLLAVLEVYCDASERPDGLFSVAGLALRKSRAKVACVALRSLYGPYGFGHMTDLNAREKQFKGLKNNSAEVRRLMRGTIQIINDSVMFGVAIGVDLKEITSFLPKGVDGFSHAYPFCCHMAMTAIGDLVSKRMPSEDLAYIFECGDKNQGEADRFMSIAQRSPELRESYRYRSHAFVPKKDNAMLWAADMFAWEYAKYWAETVMKKKIPMRKSLVSILTSGYTTLEFNKKYHVNFFTGPKLWEALATIRILHLLPDG